MIEFEICISSGNYLDVLWVARLHICRIPVYMFTARRMQNIRCFGRRILSTNLTCVQRDFNVNRCTEQKFMFMSSIPHTRSAVARMPSGKSVAPSGRFVSLGNGLQ